MPFWVPLLGVMSAVGTWLGLRYARRRSLVDAPGERRSHAVPTPRGGGIAVVAVVLGTGVFMAWYQPSLSIFWVAFSVGLFFVGGIGWWDDHRPLSATVRFVVHLLASGVLAFGVFLSGGEWTAAVASGLLSIVLINVWNFMDGINGMATCQFVLVAAAALLLWGADVSVLALACMAAGLGFLPFNFPRARIFLGDVGSGGMGFSVAGLFGLAGPAHDASSEVALVLTSAFLIDAGLTLVRRVLRGEAWWTAHVQHAYQAWARRIQSHVVVTLGFAVWTLVGALSLAWLIQRSSQFIGAFVAAWYTSGAALWWFLQNRYTDHRSPQAADSRDG